MYRFGKYDSIVRLLQICLSSLLLIQRFHSRRFRAISDFILREWFKTVDLSTFCWVGGGQEGVRINKNLKKSESL